MTTLMRNYVRNLSIPSLREIREVRENHQTINRSSEEANNRLTHVKTRLAISFYSLLKQKQRFCIALS